MADSGPEDLKEKYKRPERLVFPLLLGLKPEFRNTIKNLFGSKHGIDAPKWAKAEDADVDGWKMGKEDFKKFFGSHVAPMPYGKKVP
jgi:hypothetical protein